jgi:aspartate/methionine/tyrosine aminotransferase
VRRSSRLPARTDENALTAAVASLRAAGTPILDLTESNPTRVGLPYPDRLLAGLGDPRGLQYAPDAFGLREARRAVAADCARRGAAIDPAHVVLSASTSEAYSWIFRLLCDPGDVVLVPQPSYPLFEYLTRLDALDTAGYRLESHGRWEIDFSTIVAAPPRTRAILAVSPNNPTGSYLSATEVERLCALCRERGWALIVDEVFADYSLERAAPVTDVAARAGVLCFTLAGLSKTVGLPQLKLAWTIVGGPPAERDDALRGLELIADTFLSVATPVQASLRELLKEGAKIREAIQARVRTNLAQARLLVARVPACTVLPAEGGWSAVVRVPAIRGEEALVLDLLTREHVLVHPGYFFDFPHEAFVVVSLLPSAEVFADAFERTLRTAATAPTTV